MTTGIRSSVGFSFFWVVVCAVSVGCFGVVRGAPNVLVIMADDCTYNDLPVYGGKNARTPNLDRLAEESLVFDRAYVSMSMCQPCRSELFTGQFPLRNGCAWNHSGSRVGVRSMPQLMGGLGYRVGIAGKVHVEPEAVYPFERVAGFDGNCVRNPTSKHELAGVKSFMGRDAGEPFCLVVALVEPHVPWVMGDASAYPPEGLKLPLNLADTPRTRRDFAAYCAEITYMDGQVGEVLALLGELGLEEETVVIFTSEQGSQFPGNKWNCWDTGLHTGLMVRWPGRVMAGERTDAMVAYADVLPTLVELAGGDVGVPGLALDGRSFRRVLLEGEGTHREYVYGLHNNLPEGPAYPIRTVSDGRWRYVRNLMPGELYIQKYVMGVQGDGKLNNPYWGTWVFSSEANEASYRLVKRVMQRPAEELYDTLIDPYEMNNLVDSVYVRGVRERLAGELEHWMRGQGDPGAAMDMREALGAARRGEHLYYPGR